MIKTNTAAMKKSFPLKKIISGGQTGADRAALDAALDAKFPCGGWCPKGRKAEDGRISSRYPLQEINSKSYAERTRRNIEEADGTLLVTFGEPAGGSAYTLEYAIESGARCLHVDAAVLELSDAASLVAEWMWKQKILTLNTAGPRASKEPAIYIYVYELIERLLDMDTPRNQIGSQDSVQLFPSEVALKEAMLAAELAVNPRSGERFEPGSSRDWAAQEYGPADNPSYPHEMQRVKKAAPPTTDDSATS